MLVSTKEVDDLPQLSSPVIVIEYVLVSSGVPEIVIVDWSIVIHEGCGLDSIR